MFTSNKNRLHLSIDEQGFAQIEHLSFDAYNEGPMLQKALEAYKYRTGHYPARVLVDQIYRTKDNIAFCKQNGIRLSGPKLGRPTKDKAKNKAEKTTADKDNVDRIQIERFFSTAKRRNGLGFIDRKREDTSLMTIALSIMVQYYLYPPSFCIEPFFLHFLHLLQKSVVSVGQKRPFLRRVKTTNFSRTEKATNDIDNLSSQSDLDSY